MKPFSAILVPLDGSETALRTLGCAAWLASRLGASLHVLTVAAALSEEQAFELLGIPKKYRSVASVHQEQGQPAEEILAAVARYDIDLIALTTRAESAESEVEGAPWRVGHVARAIIEESSVPVLVLPPAYVEALPWRSALVPISGEAETDEALTLALRLAEALNLTVTLAHVAENERTSEGMPGAGHSDQAHHEYPQLLNEFIARSCPMCSAAERRRISDFRLLKGEVSRELSSLIESERTSLIVVGWHGRFMRGHAHVLKSLIQQVSCPVLLVKPQTKERSHLKVGDALV